MKMNLVDSECRLEEFNNCPGMSFLDDFPSFAKFVDVIGESDMENDRETAVFAIPYEDHDINKLKGVVDLLFGYKPDEASSEIIDGELVIRMWWD